MTEIVLSKATRNKDMTRALRLVVRDGESCTDSPTRSGITLQDVIDYMYKDTINERRELPARELDTRFLWIKDAVRKERGYKNFDNISVKTELLEESQKVFEEFQAWVAQQPKKQSL